MTTGELFILFVPLFTLFTLSLLSKIVCSVFSVEKNLLPVGLNSKGFRRNRLVLDNGCNSERTSYHEFENKFIESKSC